MARSVSAPKHKHKDVSNEEQKLVQEQPFRWNTAACIGAVGASLTGLLLASFMHFPVTVIPLVPPNLMTDLIPFMGPWAVEPFNGISCPVGVGPEPVKSGVSLVSPVCTYELVERIYVIAPATVQHGTPFRVEYPQLENYQYPELEMDTHQRDTMVPALPELWPDQYNDRDIHFRPVPLLPAPDTTTTASSSSLEALATSVDSDGEIGGDIRYTLGRRFSKGAHGEVWKGLRVGAGKPLKDGYVLKRMFVEKGPEIRLSGLREVYFGQQLKGHDHIARFEEHFEVSREGEGVPSKELWLVFRHEGTSLHDLLYQTRSDGAFVQFERSSFWWKMKKSAHGHLWLKAMIYQLLLGLSLCHQHGILHRDIKPQNLLVREEDEKKFHLRLADFGSAVDMKQPNRLYPSEGPSKNENTRTYSPPEVLFGQVPFSTKRPESYDMWSAGIVILEVLLGTADVFQIDDWLSAVIDQQLQNESDETRRAAHVYQGMQRLCIHDQQSRPLPLYSPKGRGRKWKPTKCTRGTFADVLKQLDPAGVGFPSEMGVDLLKRLLHWNPLHRPSALQALDHAYFTHTHTDGPFECACGKHFFFHSEFDQHTTNCPHREQHL